MVTVQPSLTDGQEAVHFNQSQAHAINRKLLARRDRGRDAKKRRKETKKKRKKTAPTVNTDSTGGQVKVTHKQKTTRKRTVKEKKQNRKCMKKQ